MVNEEEQSVDVLCLGCTDEKCDFRPMLLKRRAAGPDDIVIDMRFCGVCHTDLHTAAGHLTGLVGSIYPNDVCVPGHELSGVATFVGSNVTGFKIGDKIGVGCMVDSCLTCTNCLQGEEQLCSGKNTATYGGANKFGRAAVFPKGSKTLGGYTKTMVVHHKFAVLIPDDYPLESAGPVMCAGVTLYDPLKRYGATEGSVVAIVGIGGLGDMGIKVAKALGCSVTAISSTSSKETLAKAAGADVYICSSDAAAMASNAGRFDLVLNTIPSEHDYNAFTPLLKKTGKHVILGLNSAIVGATIASSIVCGTRFRASGIGGIKATQEVIDLCAKNKIYPNIEIVGAEKMNSVYETLDSKNIGALRFVLDVSTIKHEGFKAQPPPKISPSKGLSVGGSLGTILDMVFGFRG